MHHEDRAGVNAFIRGVDRISKQHLPAAVIMCTNRLGSLDPAVKRRAADILTFDRPDDGHRYEVLSNPLKQFGFSEATIKTVIKATGARDGNKYGFTYSDLMQRLLPAIILDAYPGRSIEPERAIQIAMSMQPTPPFQETGE